MQNVKLEILDISGRIVRATSDVRRATYVWDALTSPSGIYLVRVKIGDKVFNRRITLIK